MKNPAKFERCVADVKRSLSARGRSGDPFAICTAGTITLRKQKNAGLDATIDSLLSMSPTGAALKVIEKQREKLQRKLRRSNTGKGSLWSRPTVWPKRKPGRSNAAEKNWSVMWTGTMSGYSGTHVIQAGLTKAQAVRRAAQLARKPSRAGDVRYHAEQQTPAIRKLGAAYRKAADRWQKEQVRARENPSSKKNAVPAALDRYESFHGRPSDELVEISTPIHEHSVLSGLGELVKLVIVTGDGHKVTIKNFGANRDGKPAILSQNEAATQLFIDGGDQSVNLAEFGILEPYHEWETLGKVQNVYYYTRKDHLGDDGGTATYNHRFGGLRDVTLRSGRKTRKRSPLPDMVYDTRNEVLYFSGGGYTLPDEGIAN